MIRLAGLVGLIICIAGIMAACGPAQYNRPVGPEQTFECKVHIETVFWNTTYGSPLHRKDYTFTASGTPIADPMGATRPVRGNYYQVDTWKNWSSEEYSRDSKEVIDDLRFRTEKANIWLAELLRTSNFVPYLAYEDRYTSPDIIPCNDQESISAVAGNVLSTGWTTNQGYTLSITVEENTTFYRVTSLLGSEVTLLFPTEKLSKLLEAFATSDGPEAFPETTFLEPEVSAGAENYELAQLESILSVERQGISVASFRFVQDDVQGVHLLKQVLAKGIIAVAKVQGVSEVTAALTGYIGSDIKAVTAISVQESSLSMHSRTMFLGRSVQNTDMQGGSYSMNQTVSVNDVIRGDVYFRLP